MKRTQPPPPTRPKTTGDVYIFLTHAIWHCRWGSETTDREPTESDLQAIKILMDCRSAVMKEGV